MKLNRVDQNAIRRPKKIKFKKWMRNKHVGVHPYLGTIGQEVVTLGKQKMIKLDKINETKAINVKINDKHNN